MSELRAVPSPNTTAPPGPFLTIIVPVCNEEECLPILHERITKVLSDYGKPYEILFVEDGSTDGSFEILRGLHEGDPHVRVIRFARNFGQQMAITAGLQHARGEVIVLIDADLQTAPEEIPKLVDKLREGYDIVYGARTNRQDSVMRKLGSRAVSYVIKRLTGAGVPDSASGFIALDHRFVAAVNQFNEKSRYLSALFSWLSYGRTASVSVSHHERHAGPSRYRFFQLAALGVNLICNFSTVPLRIALGIGFAFMMIGFLGFLGLLLAHGISGPWNSEPHCFIVALLFLLSGVQLFASGIIGEYLGRIYREVRDQPNYVVREMLDASAPSQATGTS